MPNRLQVRTDPITVRGKQEPVPYDSTPAPRELDAAIAPHEIQVSGTTDPVIPVSSPAPNYITHPLASTPSPEVPNFDFPPAPEPKSNSYEPNAILSPVPQPLTKSFTPPTPAQSQNNAPVPDLPSAPEPDRLPQNKPLFLQDTKHIFPEAARVLPKTVQQLAAKKPVQAIQKPASEFPFSPLLQPEHKTGNHVVVSLVDKKVVILGPNEQVVAEFPAYLGKADTPTPAGQFRIMENIDKNFDWHYGPGFMSFAMDVKKGEVGQAYGFHGWKYTNEDDQEEKVNPGWKTSTHGCVQLSNDDTAKMADLVGPGDRVTILNQPLAPPPARPVVPGLGKVGHQVAFNRVGT